MYYSTVDSRVIKNVGGGQVKSGAMDQGYLAHEQHPPRRTLP